MGLLDQRLQAVCGPPGRQATIGVRRDKADLGQQGFVQEAEVILPHTHTQHITRAEHLFP